jgi:hypothetical protein
LDALLQRDPQDATALILKSQALRILNRLPEAEEAARQAFAAADSDNGRFGAAMVMAQSLSLQNRRIEAQLWLRRAAEVAPSRRAESIARRDFDLVRAATPLKLTFALSLSPSSNVNNGARDPAFELPSGYICPSGCLGGAIGASLALSGFEGAAGLAAEVRWHDSTTAQGIFAATFSNGFVLLSQEAKTTAPDAVAGNFAMTNLDFGLTEKRYDASSDSIFSASLNAGRVWYGGAALTDYLVAQMTVSTSLGARSTLISGLSHQLQVSATTGDISGRLTDGSFSAETRMAGGDKVGARVSFGFTDAPSILAENERASLQLNWSAAKPVLGIGLSTVATVKTVDYDDSLYAFEGRHDRAARLSVSAQLDQLDYLGFVPVFSLEAGRNWSNIGLYDSESFGIGLGITSKF